ncbi:MAG TPA: hypothetical protein ENN63_10210 [Bacteroidetes bacterium]|nr:hypothetical protein [Bacteroidota bacterium]
MKPLKNLYPLATWIMRLVVAFYVYAAFSGIFTEFNLQSQWFYLSLVNLLAGAGLLLGGFVRKHHITVLSSLFLLLAALYQIILLLAPVQYLTHRDLFLVAGISLFFLARGNQ